MPIAIVLPTAVCSNSTTTAGATFGCGTTSSLGRVCPGTCNSGFFGTVSAACTPAGWNVSGVCTRTCPGNPINPTNCVFNCPATLVNQTCTAQCIVNSTVGFTPSVPGAPFSTCQSNGLWSAVTGTCNRGCVGAPAPQPSATFVRPTVAAVGHRCNATCSNGTSGDVFATCPPNTFTWSVNNTQPCAAGA